MSLKEQTEKALDAAGTFQDQRLTISASFAGQQLACEMVKLESIACCFERLEVRSAALVGAAMEDLKKIAESLSGRLTYLLEPLSPIEIDEDKCAIQMRSKPPLRDDDGTTFYELLVERDGVLSLLRYQNPPAQLRRVIASEVTRSVFLRLVDDFSTALD